MDNQRLINLYQNASKHANYQSLPNCIKPFISNDQIYTNSRYEKERLDFLLRNISFVNKTVTDVGGNTGYFTFELIDAGASKVHYVEGNTEHANFVKYVAESLNKPVKISNSYVNTDDNSSFLRKTDITLLFNVIHHIGDDFGDKNISIEDAKNKMVEFIRYFSDKTEILVLQFGFCWKGDIQKPLFKNGTKEEMIEFVKQGIKNKFEIVKIGIPVVYEDSTEYVDLNATNLDRNNKIGEFRNRPIFILKKTAKA